jgi:acetyl/propionyl-CoA carboxylase alpha subunit
VDEDLRRRMGEVAVAAAKAVDYVNAGRLNFCWIGTKISTFWR